MGVLQSILKAEGVAGRPGGQLVPLVHVMPAFEIGDPK